MINDLIGKIRVTANRWGEVLEPEASKVELQGFTEKFKTKFGLEVPIQYEIFLKLVNGLEFNGLIIYGTKNSDNDPDASMLDIFEMNKIFNDSLMFNRLNVIAIGEDSSGLITYDKDTKKFQYRDRIGLDRVEQFSSFDEMLSVEIEKVI
ncbi:YrhA family protein [Photobacterium lutimaris]|uniref:YrhA family protein n=1 Tax=Photobacterium lutimaris TaxID=388278 RepID=UPI0010D7CB89|nr:YrhA family protein [Photobacterium lutimaris]TDR75717.1 hypothetical protein DFP78_10474 [Photobacterium lutimaris]